MMIVRRSGIGLRLTCKQIKEEATAILYGANTFLFTETMHPVRANSALEFPENKRLLDRLLWYGGMNDMLQMRDFFQQIGPSNLAKIRHLKLEIDTHAVFLGYVRFPINYRGYSGYSAINLSGMLLYKSVPHIVRRFDIPATSANELMASSASTAVSAVYSRRIHLPRYARRHSNSNSNANTPSRPLGGSLVN